MHDRYRCYADLAAARGRPVGEDVLEQVGGLVDGLFGFVSDLHESVESATEPMMLRLAPREERRV